MTVRYNIIKTNELKRKCHVQGVPSESLKGTATLMITIFYMRDLNKPLILIPVSSKSVEKRRSCGDLNICKWTVMEAAIL